MGCQYTGQLQTLNKRNLILILQSNNSVLMWFFPDLSSLTDLKMSPLLYFRLAALCLTPFYITLACSSYYFTHNICSCENKCYNPAVHSSCISDENIKKANMNCVLPLDHLLCHPPPLYITSKSSRLTTLFNIINSTCDCATILLQFWLLLLSEGCITKWDQCLGELIWSRNQGCHRPEGGSLLAGIDHHGNSQCFKF